jgi:hypothetical protein
MSFFRMSWHQLFSDFMKKSDFEAKCLLQRDHLTDCCRPVKNLYYKRHVFLSVGTFCLQGVRWVPSMLPPNSLWLFWHSIIINTLEQSLSLSVLSVGTLYTFRLLTLPSSLFYRKLLVFCLLKYLTHWGSGITQYPKRYLLVCL